MPANESPDAGKLADKEKDEEFVRRMKMLDKVKEEMPEADESVKKMRQETVNKRYSTPKKKKVKKPFYEPGEEPWYIKLGDKVRGK